MRTIKNYICVKDTVLRGRLTPKGTKASAAVNPSTGKTYLDGGTSWSEVKNFNKPGPKVEDADADTPANDLPDVMSMVDGADAGKETPQSLV